MKPGLALPAVTLLLAATLTACGGDSQETDPQRAPDPTDPPETASSQPSDATSGSSDGTSKSPKRPQKPRVVDTVATGLTSPWGLDFLPGGDAIVTERDTGRVLRISTQGKIREIGTIDESVPANEAGLLGVAVSPDFADDSTLFFYYSTAEDNRIVRTTYDASASNGLGDLEPIVTGIPNAQNHDGGRLSFDESGNLYASTGDAGDREAAQDRSSLAGKILRMTVDGDPAPGNPSSDSLVWSWGHRNVQGLAFDEAGNLWASEFGDQDFDELNLITKGGNYGWPRVEGEGGAPDFIDPQVVWGTDEASPSGLAFHDGQLWMASLRGERLWRVQLTGERALGAKDWFVGAHGRMRTVEVAPDGKLWVITSNTDGRADPKQGDDRILAVDPG